MPDGGWVGGGFQSSFSPIMTTRLPLAFWRKDYVWFLRIGHAMEQILADFLYVSPFMHMS